MAEKNGSMHFAGLFSLASFPKVINLIEGYNPDAIVATHVMSAQLVDILKGKGAISCPALSGSSPDLRSTVLGGNLTSRFNHIDP